MRRKPQIGRRLLFDITEVLSNAANFSSVNCIQTITITWSSINVLLSIHASLLHHCFLISVLAILFQYQIFFFLIIMSYILWLQWNWIKIWRFQERYQVMLHVVSHLFSDSLSSLPTQNPENCSLAPWNHDGVKSSQSSFLSPALWKT